MISERLQKSWRGVMNIENVGVAGEERVRQSRKRWSEGVEIS